MSFREDKKTGLEEISRGEEDIVREAEEKVFERIENYIKSIDAKTFIEMIKKYPLRYLGKMLIEDPIIQHEQHILGIIIELISPQEEKNIFLEALEKEIRRKPDDIELFRFYYSELKQKEIQLFDKMKFLEIGSPSLDLSRFFTKFGAAKSVIADPNAGVTPDICREAEKNNQFIVRYRVDKDNYKKLFSEEKFHVTFSSELLERGSRFLTNEEEMLSVEKRLTKYQEMLKVFADLTKDGGISIHEGREVPKEQEFLEKLGLKLIYIFPREEIGAMDDIYVFQKVRHGK